MSLFAGLEHIVREDEPLAPHTSLNLGGRAQFFAEPTIQEELVELVRRSRAADLSLRVIGGGSNLIVRDDGVRGLVIHLSAPNFNKLEIHGNRMVVGGGLRLSHFVATCAREGFVGPEHLVGLPGTLGGALHCNTGSGGNDIGNWCTKATAITRNGDIVVRNTDNMSFSYLSSSLNELAIVEAEFQFERDNSATLTRQMQRNWIVRRARQPAIDEPNVFVFKDHGGESASELIERAGLKGKQVGHVTMFDQNPNYFIAKSGAKSADVLQLVEMVRAQVKERLAIDLPLAVQIW